MNFELFCMALIALFVGMAICFNGYRWFLILLPIFGFFFGFGLGLDTMQFLFGAQMFGTVTGCRGRLHCWSGLRCAFLPFRPSPSETLPVTACSAVHTPAADPHKG